MVPLVIVPSTAIFIPGLAIKISPFFISSKVISSEPSLVFNNALEGVISTNFFIASLVLFLLLESIYLPSLIKKITIADDS